MPDVIPTPPVGTEVVEPLIPEEAEPVKTPEAEPQAEEPAAPTGEEPEVPEAPTPAAPQPPTVEERYRQSSSEAMILNSKNKGLESTIQQLTSEDAPTEAELLTEYPEYKDYNAVTQR